MCTAITLQSLQGEHFLGRTMDFSYEIQPHLYIVPSNYRWDQTLDGRKIRNSYRFIGIGQQLDGILGFFDGVNERGFAAAALYFAGYAKYGAPSPPVAAVQVASYDFLHYILGNCASVEDLRTQLENIYIVGKADPVTHTVAPLHWIVTDQTGSCAVLEQTARGTELLHNEIGVLANSPDFRWHMTNLSNYLQTSPMQMEEAFWGKTRLTPFGQGGGSMPLPGGYTSPERFVRTAYLKTHIAAPRNAEDAIVSGFHVLQSVSVPKGVVVTARNTYDYTRYTALMNVTTGEYFFRTHLQVKQARLRQSNTANTHLIDLGALAQPVSFEKR